MGGCDLGAEAPDRRIRSPQRRHAATTAEGWISGDQHERLDHRLRGKHAVEGITVVPFQASGKKCVILGHRKPVGPEPVEDYVITAVGEAPASSVRKVAEGLELHH